MTPDEISKLTKYFQGVMGFKHTKRYVKYVCIDCYRKLTDEYPPVSSSGSAPHKRIGDILRQEKAAGRMRKLV